MPRPASLPSLAVPEGGVLFYWFLKWIALGPSLQARLPPAGAGRRRTSPPTGPAILASNHLSSADWIFMPLTLPRRVTFLAKAEYFTGAGLKGWFAADVLLRQRPGARSTAPAPPRPRARIRTGIRILGEGDLLGHLPRGHPLARRPALPRQDRGRPAGARDRRARRPGGHGLPAAEAAARPGHGSWSAVVVRFGKPLDFSPLRGPGRRPLHPAVDHRRDHVRDHAAVRPGVRRRLRRAR